ncbi:MAG: potassium channel family protein [Bryobacteraceae bacterium]
MGVRLQTAHGNNSRCNPLPNATRPGVPTGEPARLIYFSFETLTTVSYGDAYPVHRVARSLAIAEALIGQLYPAILIATLVGMALQERFNAALKETGGKKAT